MRSSSSRAYTALSHVNDTDNKLQQVKTLVVPAGHFGFSASDPGATSIAIIAIVAANMIVRSSNSPEQLECVLVLPGRSSREVGHGNDLRIFILLKNY